MRIVFNATAAREGTSGFVHATRLLGELAGLPSRHEYFVLTGPGQQALRDALPNVGHHVLPSLADSGLARTVALQWLLPRVVRRLGATLVYNKGNFYAPCAGRQVCFIENANPFSVLNLGEPTWYRARNRMLRLMSNQAVARADAVVFPSETARGIVARRAKVRARSFVVPYGADLPPPPSNARPIGRPFVLCVAAVLPYKNLLRAVEALACLRERRRFDGDLVIVGISDVNGAGYYRRLLTARIAETGLVERVHLLAPVTPERLAELYAAAECLLMPSIEETFGIPLIEAMSLGTPVVASRVTGGDVLRYFIPFEEICAEAAEYFDPFDTSSCADALERAMSPSRRQDLANAGRERARRYSWRAAAEGTHSVFETLA